jgi:beta propeller repeat protein
VALKKSMLVLNALIIVFAASIAQVEGTEIPICTEPSRQWPPAISGSKIVWADERNGNSDIYLYDLDTGLETPVCTHPSSQRSPAISGNKVVWQDNRNGNADIYLFNLDTNLEMPVCTNPSGQWFIAISGNRIVWWDDRNGHADIYCYDLNARSEIPICTNANYKEDPAISGSKIVWSERRNDPSSGDIYLYDLHTGIETPICINPSGQFDPAISGNKIVWGDDRNGNADLYLYDLDTGIETPVCTNPRGQYSSAISGNKIVWYDMRNGDENWDIYLYDPDASAFNLSKPKASVRLVEIYFKNSLNELWTYLQLLKQKSTMVIATATAKYNSTYPPTPYEDYGACPFECCQYGKWTSKKEVVIRSSRSSNAPSAFTVHKGDKVSALTGIVVTHKLGGASVKEPCKIGKLQAKAGDFLWVLRPTGEGYYEVWYKGEVASVWPDDPSTEQDGGEHRETIMIKEPEYVWWVQIKNSLGQVGWTNQPYDFDGNDACG